MGVSNSMEDGMIDEETRAALTLTKDDLLAMLNASEPASVAHTRRPPREADRVALESSEPSVNALLRSRNEGPPRARVVQALPKTGGEIHLVS